MENLRKIREERKVNQLKIAMDLEISQESISKYETGVSFPSKVILLKLADYFNCSIDFLMGRTDNPKINTDTLSTENERIENLIFRYNRLSEKDKNKLEGCLLAIEHEGRLKVGCFTHFQKNYVPI